jgi:hypothetical protein
VRLTLFERAILSNISPPMGGDILTIRAADKFKYDVALSQREIRKYKVHRKGAKLVWKAKADGKMKEIYIPPFIKERIIQTLQTLNSEKKLKQEHLSLYDKFLGEYNGNKT